MPTQIELIREAAKRGILPDDLKPLYDEAVKRGLIQPATPAASIGKDVIGRVGIGQGLGMGYGDEITAFARSRLGGEDYDTALAEERAKIAQAKQDYPIGSTVAEVGGALAPAAAAIAGSVMSGGSATPAAAPVLARTGTLVGNVLRGGLRGAALGGAQGVVEGFGKGEGGFENRLARAGAEGMLGAGVGGTLGAVAPAIGAGVRAVTASPQNRSADRMLDLLAEEGLSPQQVAQDYATRQAAGAKPEILADLYPGSSVAAESRRVLNVPGADRGGITNMLSQRLDDQGTRVTQAFERAAGTDQKFFPVVDALEKARSQAAAPLYQQAYSQPVRNATLDALITRAPDEAFAQVKKLARYQGLDIPDLVGVDRAGRRTVVADYGLREIDLLKQGLDNIIDNATDKVTGKIAKEALPAIKLKQDILGVVDNLVPEYASARAAWAGPTAVRSAMDMGQRIFNERAEVTAKDIMKLNPSEKEGFLIGVLDAVNQRIGRKIEGQDVTGAFRSGNAKAQIEAALSASGKKPDEVRSLTNALFGDIEREAAMAQTNRALRSVSPTFPMMAQDQAFREGMSAARGVLNDFRTGGLGGGIAGGIGRMADRAALGLTQEGAERTNRQLADILFRNNPQSVQEAMDLLAARSLRRGRYATPRSVLPGLLADPLTDIGTP